MKFMNSPYYNEEFLGKILYSRVVDKDEILTIQEFFNTNNNQKEYLKKGRNVNNVYYNYKLVIYGEYYELDCQNNDEYLYLVFDKPVHVVGKYCHQIIAPEIIVKNRKNSYLSYCVADKMLIDNNNSSFYEIFYSKINIVYFYNEKIFLNKSEINNLFIFNQHLYLYDDSKFLNYHKIKCFGECEYLKNKTLNYEDFKNGIIHIE